MQRAVFSTTVASQTGDSKSRQSYCRKELTISDQTEEKPIYASRSWKFGEKILKKKSV